jgi:antitoxin component of MazEF toxin-antitoxin module
MSQKEEVDIQAVEEGGFVQLPKQVMDALGLSPGKEVKFRMTGNRVTLERHIADPFAEYRNRPQDPGMGDLIKAEAEKKKEVSKEFEERLKEKPEFTPEDHPDFWR